MANKSGRIGREGEHKATEYLKAAGFVEVEREGRRAKALDVVGTDLSTPVEVKRRKTISLPAWVRDCREAHGDEWALFVIQRDARTKEGLTEDVVVFPAAMAARLLRMYEENHT